MVAEVASVSSSRPTKWMVAVDNENQILGEQRLERELGVVDGRWTTAALKRPVRRPGMSAEVLPSDTMTRTCGWSLASDDSSCGRSQRAVVPSMPSRTSPATWPSIGATSAAMSSSSRRIRRARSTTRSPSSVSPPCARSTKTVRARSPAGRCGRHVGLHREEGAGGSRERAVVGDRDECRKLTHVHKPSFCSAICPDDSRHLSVLLVRCLACAYTHKHKFEAIHPPCTAR